MPEDNTSNREQPASTPLQTASVVGGWLGVIAIIVGLLWAAVVKSFSLVPLVIIIGGAALALLWLIVNIAKVIATARGRQAKLILNSAAFIVVILGIVVLVNYVAARHHVRSDLTKSKQYSLSEQTRAVAQGLEQNITLIAFFSEEHKRSPYSEWPEISDRLREYEMLSPRISVEQYDPKTNFAKLKEYDVQVDGTVIVKAGEETEKVSSPSEEQLTSALLAVSRGEKTKIYFLTGHGEGTLEGTGPKAIGTLKQSLENQQYQVETLSLMAMAEPQVPDDCAALVIIGPSQPLHEKETTALRQYLGFGGKLFAAVDPPPAPGLRELLADHGITPLDGIVLDPQLSLWGQVEVPMVTAPASHEITRNLGAVILPVTRAFELETPEQPQYPGGPPPQPSARALLESSQAAWLETNPTGTVEKDSDEKGGPLVMAALVDKTTPPAPMMPGMPPPPGQEGVRMVVVGTSIMMSDDLVGQGVDAGVYFTLKSIAWLTESEKLISIPPKDTMPSYITLSDRQRNAAIVAVFALPALVMLSGAVVWWRRRRG